MTLQELKYLIALAKFKHFGNAAKASFVSQPSLSIAIQKLEHTLGVALVERHKNKVEMTAVGLEVVDQAKRVLSEMDAIHYIAKKGQDQLSGVLKLGAIFTVGPYLLPNLVTKLHKRAPNMPLEIQENFTEQLRVKLKTGELDVILVAEPFNEPGVEKRVLYEEGFVVMLPKSHQLGKRKIVKPVDLYGETILLLGKGHCFRDHVLEACPDCYVDKLGDTKGIHTNTFEGASLETIRHMVASGMGLTILPETAARLPSYLKNDCVLLPLQSKTAKRKIIMVWRSQFPRMAAIECVADAVKGG